MPLPIIVIIQALYAGGTLVAHSSGGFIVTAAGSYIASTFISTSALAAYLAAAGLTTVAGIGTLIGISGIIGSAGLMGSSLGATGFTAVFMRWGIINSTPSWIPILIIGAAAGLIFMLLWSAYKYRKTIKRIFSAKDGEEVIFTEKEAKMVQKLLVITYKKQNNITFRRRLYERTLKLFSK